MTDRLQVGIVGTGGVSEDHFRAYRAANADVVAIADINEDLLARRAAEWGVENTFIDYHDLLGLDNIDAVSVCTPNAFHHPVTVAAARAGKHVLCEKPIALSLELANEMIDACRSAGVVLQVNHRLRASKAVQKAKTMIAEGVIGNLTYLRIRQAHDWAGADRVADSFGSLTQAGGGTLIDNGVHVMDLLRVFGGEIDEVFARTGTLKFDTEVEDTSVVTVRFTSGALGCAENAWTATGWEEGFWIYGTKGALEYTNRHGRNVRPILYHSYRESPGQEWNCRDVDAFAWQAESTHDGSIGAFVRVITNGHADVLCTGEDGREAVRLVLASYESSRLGRPVVLE